MHSMGALHEKLTVQSAYLPARGWIISIIRTQRFQCLNYTMELPSKESRERMAAKPWKDASFFHDARNTCASGAHGETPWGAHFLASMSNLTFHQNFLKELLTSFLFLAYITSDWGCSPSIAVGIWHLSRITVHILCHLWASWTITLRPLGDAPFRLMPGPHQHCFPFVSILSSNWGLTVLLFP